MPLADCIGVPSPCAPSTSEKGFIASGTSAMCDLPSGPLYTLHTFGMFVPQVSPARSARGGSGLRNLADDLRFVDELDPAVQNVKHLEVAQVLVQARRVQVVTAPGVLLDPDGVGAELAVLREARAEQLLQLTHGRPPLWILVGASSSQARRTRTWCRPSWR